jgi:hypothetical protein
MYFAAAPLRRQAVIVVQQSSQALSPFNWAGGGTGERFRANQPVLRSLVIPFPVVVSHELRPGFAHRASPNKITRSRHDSLMLRTSRSACPFRFGLRGRIFTEETPVSASTFTNSAVNKGSRS